MLAWIILLCLVGLVLVFAEMLIPGFGIFGILGGIFLLGMGLLVANIYGMVAFLITVVILIGVFILLIVMVKKSGVYQKVILNDKQEAKDFDESILQDLNGRIGVTKTTLQPYGVARFREQTVDVCSEGDFIDKNETVIVTNIQGKTVTVKKYEEQIGV